jgi:5-formyltetrahydrofolate cyclo-ligase
MTDFSEYVASEAFRAVVSEKDAIRAKLRQARKAAFAVESAQLEQAAVDGSNVVSRSHRICAHIEMQDWFVRTRHCLAYWAVGSEADLGSLITKFQSEKVFGLPRILHGRDMTFDRIPGGLRAAGSPVVGEDKRTDDGSIRLGAFSIPELQDAEPMDLSLVDLVLVPLLGFDSYGNRIGNGKGYYDTFITAMRQRRNSPTLVGVATAIQQVDRVPTDPWDIRLDCIVTEDGVQEF